MLRETVGEEAIFITHHDVGRLQIMLQISRENEKRKSLSLQENTRVIPFVSQARLCLTLDYASTLFSSPSESQISEFSLKA